MDAVEAAIDNVEREIDQVTAEARTAVALGREEEARWLYTEKQQLRKKEEQLRNEKAQLREEELIALRAADHRGKRRREDDASDNDEQHAAKRRRGEDFERSVLQRLQALEEMQKTSCQMSTASESAVTELLRAVDLTELRDRQDLEEPGVEFRCDGLDPFPMQDYPQETDSYEPFKARLEATLSQRAELIGEKGFKVTIINNSNPITVAIGTQLFKGFMDLAVAPADLMGNSIIQQIRIGLELKHTHEQKSAREGAKGQAGTDCEEKAKLAGLELTAKPKAQAYLQLIACCALAEHPLIIFLTDGIRYHRMRLSGRGLYVHPDMRPRQALFSMTNFLAKASTNPLFSLDKDGIACDVDQQDAAALRRMRQVQTSMREQAESVLAHLTNPTERLVEANAIIESWKRASGRELCVPQWLARICG